MLKIRGNGNNKTFICSIDDSECLGHMCNYAECRERKLSDTGLCLRPAKVSQKAPVSKIQQRNHYSKYDYMTPNDLDDKFRKKLTKKFK